MSTWESPSARGGGAEPNYTKRIEPQYLKPILDPLKNYLFQISGTAILLWSAYYIPSWRWQWRQRKLFHRHVVGRVIDLVPNVGEARWQKLYLDFSRASFVHLVGRRSLLSKQPNEPEPDNRPKAPNPLRKTKSYGYQIQEEQIREAELQKENKEAAQDVYYDMIEDACMPDTQLGISDIIFRPADVEKLEYSTYDTAVLFSCLAWEDEKIAGERLQNAWKCLKPGGALMVIDIGRPSPQILQKAADFVESFKTTSLRLTMDYEKYIEENFKDAVLPFEDRKRYLFGFRYSFVVRKETENETKERVTREILEKRDHESDDTTSSQQQPEGKSEDKK